MQLIPSEQHKPGIGSPDWVPPAVERRTRLLSLSSIR